MVLKKNRKPRYNNISMHLDAKVFDIKPKQGNEAKSFDYWLSLATLERGNRVYIPINKNAFAESLDGKFLNFIQISKENDNIVTRRVKELKKKQYQPITPLISIDLGINPIIATDKGDLIGGQFFDLLKNFDAKIAKRLSYCQKKKIRPSQDEKYRNLVNKFRGFLRNEIGRYINNLINIYKPAKIEIEKLDFRSPELSRKLNRLIQNFGKKLFKEKLNRISETFGIEIEEINPAYTSQECSSCGYVDKNNRKSTQEFQCIVCGKKINA
ncbi:MAG: zinc ribbon domain-containing protein [Caldisericaceae bacterium]